MSDSTVSRRDLAVSRAVPAAGCSGFPQEVQSLTQSRRLVERERLPLIRSSHRWLEVYNRLVAAEASGARAEIETARDALAAAPPGRAGHAPGPRRLSEAGPSREPAC